MAFVCQLKVSHQIQTENHLFKNKNVLNCNCNTLPKIPIRFQARPGALSLEKCLDLGVPTGPFLGQLKNGHDVKLDNGTVVHAADVRAPDDPGPAFCILDIPTEDYLDSLEANQSAFEPHQTGGKCADDLAVLVIHFTPAHIMQHPTYRAFMDRFPESTNHLVLNETNK